ncbi:4210_t:CDS:2 [Entrophospora sp. SA101]|nr:12498_t:CDS:2 [Entrophospora sp. SA101]CAJ0834487.1 18656_t:CDS:2 [Entrophospora sp. SA101]CAJ0853477.1 4210_t:CDS:2 [Entrophospora sp. SA101]
MLSKDLFLRSSQKSYKKNKLDQKLNAISGSSIVDLPERNNSASSSKSGISDNYSDVSDDKRDSKDSRGSRLLSNFNNSHNSGGNNVGGGKTNSKCKVIKEKSPTKSQVYECLISQVNEKENRIAKIIKDAVNDAFARQKIEEIPVSKLSQAMIMKIESKIGIREIRMLHEEFDELLPRDVDKFIWNMDIDEPKHMNDIKNWFQDALGLPKKFVIKNIHKEITYERYLQTANVLLKGKADLSIGPGGTSCIWVEIKKDVHQGEAQAIGELLIADKIFALGPMVVLTDCVESWIIYFIIKQDDEFYIAIGDINDRGVALAIIRTFLLQEEQKYNNLIKGDLAPIIVKLPTPFRNKARFKETIV